MADYTIAEERLISGKGVLKVSADEDNFRHAYLILDVVRNPTQPYLNNNWNPPRAKYAFLTFRRNEYVIGNAYMEWERQMYDTVPDITSQNLIAIKCQYQGVLQSFANLGDALGVNPVSITDLIKDYESLSLQWDEVLIKCYADTAIQARLYYLLDDTCNLESRKRKRIPPPPPPLPKVPPGTAIGDISEPYDGEDDGGNTEPYPGDEIPPPPDPQPSPCDKLLVTVRVGFQNGTFVDAVGVGSTGGLQYAPVVQAFVETAPGVTRARVQGGAAVGSASCDGTTNYNLLYSQSFNPANPIISAEITNIEIVP